MRVGAGVEYALARVAARVRGRATEAEWARIEIVRTPSALLDAARAIPAFAAWLGGTTADEPLHALDVRFRTHWRAIIAELASWMPARWQPAVDWCASLADLFAIAHLARRPADSWWMASDDALGPLRERALAAGLAQALRESPLRPLAATIEAGAPVTHGWHSAWRDRLPPLTDDDERQFAAIERTLERHRFAFSAEAGDGWPLRRELAGRLAARYHASAGSPAAAFAWLALVALDGERLRGEVFHRLAFPSPVPTP